MEQDKFNELIYGSEVRIILDTNIILGLAEYEHYTTENILEIFDKCIDLIYLPHQVFEEIENNKDKIYKAINSKEDNMTKNFDVIVENIDENIKKYQTIVTEKKYYSNNEMLREISTAHDQLKKLIKNYTSNFITEYGKYDKPQIIHKIIGFSKKLEDKNKIGRKTNFSRKLEIISEGEFRYRNLIPPGFCDYKKIGIDKYGDLFIWKEILELPRTENVSNFIFVTDDKKEDWWKIHNGKPIKIHSELLNEFEELNPMCNIEFLTLQNFQLLASKYYDLYKIEVYVDLNKDDNTYINKIKFKIADFIAEEIFTYDLEYFISGNIGGEGIHDFEDTSCEFSKITNVSKQYVDDVEIVYVYKLEYDVFASFISYDYCGRDDDTKELIFTNDTEHEFTGKVIVSLERTILKNNLELMNENKGFDNLEILSVNIEETKCKKYCEYEPYF